VLLCVCFWSYCNSTVRLNENEQVLKLKHQLLFVRKNGYLCNPMTLGSIQIHEKCKHSCESEMEVLGCEDRPNLLLNLFIPLLLASERWP